MTAQNHYSTQRSPFVLTVFPFCLIVKHVGVSVFIVCVCSSEFQYTGFTIMLS